MDEKLFFFVISFFANWGWQSLGKVPNPVTGKEEKDLKIAQQVIDILQMLKEKTKGNLSTEEARALDSVLADLQLNYVEEAEKDKKKESEAAPEEKTEKPAP